MEALSNKKIGIEKFTLDAFIMCSFELKKTTLLMWKLQTKHTFAICGTLK